MEDPLHMLDLFAAFDVIGNRILLQHLEITFNIA